MTILWLPVNLGGILNTKLNTKKIVSIDSCNDSFSQTWAICSIDTFSQNERIDELIFRHTDSRKYVNMDFHT